MRTIEVELIVDAETNSMYFKSLDDHDVELVFTVKGRKESQKFLVDYFKGCTLRFDK